MKFHETHFEEYVASVDKYNIHDELVHLRDTFPPTLAQFGNLIFHGPSGVGKYSQILWLIKKYSPSELKYDKRMTIQTEKQQYIYRISDIHYEIDMDLLGCNSKIIWHEIFGQIVDIVSMKPNKKGIILCKNFAMIHNELLDIFYSYMQQYNHPHLAVQLNFILLTEHVSFLPNSILNSCRIINVGRPVGEAYDHILKKNNEKKQQSSLSLSSGIQTQDMAMGSMDNAWSNDQTINQYSNTILDEIEPSNILNIKEIYSFELIKEGGTPPKDIFNIICDAIIQEILHPEKLVITEFRDVIYDILVYNLDVSDCIWYIFTYFVRSETLKANDISDILMKQHPFFKHYNNNYRPIYHLENIFFYILNKIHHFDVKRNPFV